MAGKPKQRTSNQHTVPRCYLKRFAGADLRFFSFNKLFKKSREIGTRSATVEEDFYSLHPGTLASPDVDTEWVETTFSKLESRYEDVLSDTIREAGTGQLSVDTASYLAQFMTLQWLRTVGMRKVMVAADEQLKQEWVNRWYAEHAPGVPPGKFKRGPGYEAGLQANALFDKETVFGTAQQFWDLYWIVGRNRTNQPFFTSDDPVVRDRTPPANDGPAVPPWVGIEYAFPLSSEFILVMMDRYMFSQTADTGGANVERMTLEMGEVDVERYNALQVVKSTQYVFCRENKFELATRLCSQEPGICDPDRSRELVESTTLTQGTGPVSVVIPA